MNQRGRCAHDWLKEMQTIWASLQTKRRHTASTNTSGTRSLIRGSSVDSSRHGIRDLWDLNWLIAGMSNTPLTNTPIKVSISKMHHHKQFVKATHKHAHLCVVQTHMFTCTSNLNYINKSDNYINLRNCFRLN